MNNIVQYNNFQRIDLRQLQYENLIKILSLNKASTFEEINSEDPYIWKILVFDTFCQESLSTIFKVGNLRDENITLHLNLHTQRDKIHGVNTIYYMQPTEENIIKLIEDFDKDLYDAVYINFAYPVEEALLQRLTKSIAKYNAFYKLKQVYQHYLNYIANTPSLFDLNIPKIYQKMKDPKERSGLVAIMAQSLVSVLMTLRTLPVVYYQAGISEEVAKKIDAIMTDVISEFHYKNPHDQFFTKQSTLVLTNRDIDHTCLLLHPWHYGALLDDIIKIKNNKIELPSATSKSKTEEYDLDYKADKFWAENLNLPFPDAIKNNDNELNRWQIEYEAMNHKKETSKVEDISANLSSALDKVPEMTERKKKIEMHTNLATHLSEQINIRSLDKYFEVEETLIFKKYLSSKDKEEFFSCLRDERTDSKDFVLDKARLIAIYHQSIDEPDSKDLAKIEQATQSLSDKLDQRVKEYLKVRRLKPATNAPTPDIDDPAAASVKFLKGFAKTVTSKGKGILKNMLPGSEKSFTAVKLVADVFVDKNFLNNEGISHINLAARVDSKNLEKTNDCILFLCDGGCMNEYQNFTELADKINGNVIYGCAYMYNAKEFLSEC